MMVPHAIAAFESELAAARAEEVARGLEHIAQRELGGLSCELRSVTHPSPAVALCEQASEWKADLCVVGTHGRGGLSRLLLGSVAERVVRHAPCDVLVARPGAALDGCVLAPIDFSTGSETAVERARSLARKLDLPLELLHVHDESVPVVAEDGRSFVSSAAMKERLERHLAGVSEAYFGSDHDVGTTVITSRKVPDAIVRFAADYHASLVVVGTHGRTGAARFFIGGVAERTVRLAPCSVLVVRAR